MKNMLLLGLVTAGLNVLAQQNHPLPAKVYNTMHDSTTAVDVTLFHTNNSVSLEGHNVQIFNSFFEPATTGKTNVAQAGVIMWQIYGREYLSGSLFLGDSTGYLVTKVNNVEYVNRINEQGTKFFKDRQKK